MAGGAAAAGAWMSANAGYIAAATAAVSAASQHNQQKNAATAAKNEAELKAEQEKLAATQRESDRKERLAYAMSSQTASAGARGVISSEGSPLTVLQEDIRREEVATERDIFGSKLASSTALIRGRNKERSLKSGANIGLIGDIGKVASIMPAGK